MPGVLRVVPRLRASRKPGYRAGMMGRLEQQYVAEVLEPARSAGAIADWMFEALKLQIGDRCWYTPDFLVVAIDGTLELHEVKGFWRDDARVKVKAVAARFPFRFVAAQRNKGAWTVEEL